MNLEILRTDTIYRHQWYTWVNKLAPDVHRLLDNYRRNLAGPTNRSLIEIRSLIEEAIILVRTEEE